MKFTSEEIKLAMTCATPEEIVEKAAAAGRALTPEAARVVYESLHGTGEVSDDALGAVSGGGACTPPVMRCTNCGRNDRSHLDPVADKMFCEACQHHFDIKF